jgi:hypothetical protein
MAEKIELYEPSNGTELDGFACKFCFECSKMPISCDAKNQCGIFGRVMMYKKTDKEYPKQWRYIDGKPSCTAFVSREEANAKRRSQPRKSPVGDTQTLELF